MSLASGTRLGPYEITALLGAGGMGEVYRAHDSELRRDVAIKVLPAGRASDADYMARFQREARVLASLNHPNIAAIYGLEEGAIVMELVEGSDVRGPLALEEALNIARHIADAVAAAHERGIVHRDLKPPNIRITPEGVVKVLDFGLAKGLERTSFSGDPQTSSTMTIAGTLDGVIIGTAAYMAPEQARGQAVDERADIWAFGAVLYELLTGKRPFEGDSMPDVLAAVLHHEPDWNALPSATPARVRELLGLCLVKDRRHRLQAIGDARILLNAPPQDAVATVAVPGRQILAWAVAVMAVMALIASWRPWRVPATVADRPFMQLDLESGADEFSQPAISPDGMRIVFVSKGALVIRRLDQAKTTPLAGTEGASYPFFSPNGQWVAFFAGRKLQKVAVEGGIPVQLCDAPAAQGGTWGADDSIVAGLGEGLARVPAAGGAPQILTHAKADPAGTLMHLWPQVLPGGKGVLFAATNGSSQGSLRVLTLNDDKLKTVVEDSTYGRYLAGGFLVYYQQGALFAAPMDTGRLELTGPALPLVDAVSSLGAGRAEFDVSNSGTLVYRGGTAGSNFVLSWLYPSGKIQPVVQKPGNFLSPRLSPDGTRLALAVIQAGKQNIWVYDLSRETWTRLTSGAEPELLPTWTPDGEFLVFRSGNTLAWTRSDGSGTVERLALVSRNAGPWSFSAHGEWLAFWPLGPGSDLWTVPVERAPGVLRLGQPQPLLEHAGSQGAPAISPDDRWVAYTSDESGHFEIYVMPFSPRGRARSGKWAVSNGGGFSPVWSRNTRELFYSNNRRLMAAAYTVKGDVFAADKPHVWSETLLGETGLFQGFDVAPDGKRVLVLLSPEDSGAGAVLRVMLNADSELRRRAPMQGK